LYIWIGDDEIEEIPWSITGEDTEGRKHTEGGVTYEDDRVNVLLVGRHNIKSSAATRRSKLILEGNGME